MPSDVLRIFVACVAVLCLPGAALMPLTRRSPDEQTLTMSLGLSLALLPMGFLLLSTLHVSVNRSVLAGGIVLCGALTAISAIVRQRTKRAKRTRHLQRHWPEVGLLIIFIMTLLWRFIQVRDLVLPAWVDSLHHTAIVDALRTTGLLPAALPAYGPSPFYYHFGFHVMAAAFAELADLPSAYAILVMGQFLNAVSVLAIYCLGKTLTRRPSVGLIAAALTGLLSQMPAYFVSWGRYTLLTGLILLTLALASVVEVWRYPQQRRTRWLLMLLVAGLILTHYIAAVYFGGFVLALMLVGESPGRTRWRRCQSVLIGSSGGLALASPWLVHVASSIAPLLSLHGGAGWAGSESVRLEVFNRFSYTLTLISPPRMWLVMASAVWAMIASRLRQPAVRLLLAWALILAVLSNEWLWRIAPLRSDLLLLSLFVPLNVLAAIGIVRLRRLIHPAARRWRIAWPSIVLAGLLAWGAAETVSIINPVTILAQAEDVEAADWVKYHTPPEARFAINVAHWGSFYRGVDGGWWLPLLSQRATILPPGIFYAFSTKQPYVQAVHTAAEQISLVDGCTPYFWWVMRQQQITHIYVSGQGGSLNAAWLNTCAGIERVYANRRVTIYRVTNAAVPAFPVRMSLLVRTLSKRYMPGGEV